jgi:hypothetical protein
VAVAFELKDTGWRFLQRLRISLDVIVVPRRLGTLSVDTLNPVQLAALLFKRWL